MTLASVASIKWNAPKVDLSYYAALCPKPVKISSSYRANVFDRKIQTSQKVGPGDVLDLYDLNLDRLGFFCIT